MLTSVIRAAYAQDRGVPPQSVLMGTMGTTDVGYWKYNQPRFQRRGHHLRRMMVDSATAMRSRAPKHEDHVMSISEQHFKCLMAATRVVSRSVEGLPYELQPMNQ